VTVQVALAATCLQSLHCIAVMDLRGGGQVMRPTLGHQLRLFIVVMMLCTGTDNMHDYSDTILAQAVTGLAIGLAKQSS
jgi:hypothetical protein